MKKIYFVFVLLICASMILSACGGGTASVHTAPNDPSNPTGDYTFAGTTYVMPSPVDFGNYTERVSKCFEEAVDNDASLLITDLTFGDEAVDNNRVFWCGEKEIGADDVMIMSTIAFTQVIPGRYDDATILGLTAVYEGGKWVIKGLVTLIIAAVAEQGIEGLVVYHSNKDHSPTIQNSDARRVIAAFIAAWIAFTTTGGQDPRSNCGVVKEGSKIIKVAFAFLDSATGKTYTLWYWAKTNGTPWGGAYPKELTGKGSFEAGPKDLKPNWSWTSGLDLCNGLIIPKLQAAQP